MTDTEMFLLVFGGVYMLLNAFLIPLNMNMIVKLKEEREETPDINKRYAKKTFEELYLFYSWTTGIFFLPSILIALLCLRFKKNKSK